MKSSGRAPNQDATATHDSLWTKPEAFLYENKYGKDNKEPQRGTREANQETDPSKKQRTSKRTTQSTIIQEEKTQQMSSNRKSQ